MLKLQSLQNMSKNQINKDKINSVELSKKKKKKMTVFREKGLYLTNNFSVWDFLCKLSLVQKEQQFHTSTGRDSSKLLLLLSRFSRVRLCATPQMAAHHAPLSPGFCRQEYWSRLPFPPP